MNRRELLSSAGVIGFGALVAADASAQEVKAKTKATAAQRAELIAELTALQKRAESVEAALLEIRAKRAEVRTALRAATDFECECDANFCHTEKQNELVNAAETDRYCHDDQDRGTLSIRCNDGKIEIVISRAVWSTAEEYDRKTLPAGESWQRNIDPASSTWDQTNIVEVRGIDTSHYNMDFKSWDN